MFGMEYIARHYHMDLALVWALRFIESFLILARQNTGETIRIAVPAKFNS